MNIEISAVAQIIGAVGASTAAILNALSKFLPVWRAGAVARNKHKSGG